MTIEKGRVPKISQLHTPTLCPTTKSLNIYLPHPTNPDCTVSAVVDSINSNQPISPYIRPTQTIKIWLNTVQITMNLPPEILHTSTTTRVSLQDHYPWKSKWNNNPTSEYIVPTYSISIYIRTYIHILYIHTVYVVLFLLESTAASHTLAGIRQTNTHSLHAGMQASKPCLEALYHESIRAYYLRQLYQGN